MRFRSDPARIRGSIAPVVSPFTADGANINLLVLNDLRDPVSGGTPHRSSLCRVRKATPA